MTSSAEGDLSSSPNFGPKAVHMTASKPRAPAHVGNLGMSRGGESPFFHEPIRDSQFVPEIPSRSRSAFCASSRLLGNMCAQRTRTGFAFGSITRVIRPSFDWRANSTGTKGPSLNHSPRMGSCRESQTSEPHARHAIFVLRFGSAIYDSLQISLIFSLNLSRNGAFVESRKSLRYDSNSCFTAS